MESLLFEVTSQLGIFFFKDTTKHSFSSLRLQWVGRAGVPRLCQRLRTGSESSQPRRGQGPAPGELEMSPVLKLILHRHTWGTLVISK